MLVSDGSSEALWVDKGSLDLELSKNEKHITVDLTSAMHKTEELGICNGAV